MRLASVVLDISTRALSTPYTYRLDETALDAAEAGCAVLVPFGRRDAIGFILKIFDSDDRSARGPLVGEDFDPGKLKPIKRVLSKPYFTETGAELAQFLAERYVAPLSLCVRLLIPPGALPKLSRAGSGDWKLEEPSVREVDDRWAVPGPAFAGFQPAKRAFKQAAIVSALAEGELRVEELTREYGNVSSSLKSLEKQGVIVIEHRRRMRGAAGEGARDEGASTAERIVYAVAKTPACELTAGQAEALAVIRDARKRASGEVVLVDGVTGSGKTEVYLRAIEEVLSEGKGAIVVVPEISLTPQTVARFRGRFGDRVAVLHSRMSDGERYDQWDFIRSGAARVVVGARSALFALIDPLGLIVIDEEHETTYKQENAPRYVSRDVAVWLAQRSCAAVVLGSATPSIEALYECAKNESWHRVVLPERANRSPMPAIEVIDMAKEFQQGSRSMFSRALGTALAEELDAGRKVVLLLNQRGFAKFLLCRDCGFVPECPSCSTSLTYHERGHMLSCHYCGYEVPAPAVCPRCGSPYLKRFGTGTERVEADLRVLIDGTCEKGAAIPIIRMDADTTKGKDAHAKLLERFATADAAVLLGTQMIAKGLDFDDVTLVGVVNADTQLHLPDFRAAERTFDLIQQVAGRAGRAALPGRVMVQTYVADESAISAAASYDRPLFLRSELPKRKMLGYPPYCRLVNVVVWGKSEGAVRDEANAIFSQLNALVSEDARARTTWKLLAAAPCVMARLRDNWRWHILIKCPNDDEPARLLGPFMQRRKTSAAVNVAVDVDPLDML